VVSVNINYCDTALTVKIELIAYQAALHSLLVVTELLKV